MKNDIEVRQEFNINKFHLQDGNIYLSFNGDDFKFIDVPGDGDCFYHSVLKYGSIQDKFNGVQELRQYMRDIIAYLYYNDGVLRFLFSYERQDVRLWCLKITWMGVWATTFDTLIFSYIMRLNVVVIENYLNGFSANNMHCYLQQLRLPDVIPNKPAIHVFFHQFGRSLDLTNNGNHFAYLKSTSLPTDERLNYDTQNRQRQSIISQESEALDAYQQSTIASRLVTTSVIQSPSVSSILPIPFTKQQSNLELGIITQESNISDREQQDQIASKQVHSSTPSPPTHIPILPTLPVISKSSSESRKSKLRNKTSTSKQMQTSIPPTPSSLSIPSTSMTDSTKSTHATKQNTTSSSDTFNLPVVPDLCKTINRTGFLDECLTQLSRTNTSGCNRKACICVICDCFIIGVEKICWLSEERLIAKKSYLSVSHLEATANKRIPIGLRNQYKIDNNDFLSSLLLSPRARVKNGEYMACKSCYKYVAYNHGEKPPKYAISNGWLVGEIPKTIIGNDISDILASSVAKVRIFGNVVSYNAGAHKTIKGHHDLVHHLICL